MCENVGRACSLVVGLIFDFFLGRQQLKKSTMHIYIYRERYG